jgi:hypothetical protein
MGRTAYSVSLLGVPGLNGLPVGPYPWAMKAPENAIKAPIRAQCFLKYQGAGLGDPSYQCALTSTHLYITYKGDQKSYPLSNIAAVGNHSRRPFWWLMLFGGLFLAESGSQFALLRLMPDPEFPNQGTYAATPLPPPPPQPDVNAPPEVPAVAPAVPPNRVILRRDLIQPVQPSVEQPPQPTLKGLRPQPQPQQLQPLERLRQQGEAAQGLQGLKLQQAPPALQGLRRQAQPASPQEQSLPPLGAAPPAQGVNPYALPPQVQAQFDQHWQTVEAQKQRQEDRDAVRGWLAFGGLVLLGLGWRRAGYLSIELTSGSVRHLRTYVADEQYVHFVRELKSSIG